MTDAPSIGRLSPWHAGELALQRKMGVADRMDAIGWRVMLDYMPEQHRAFYPQLPFCVLGTVDRDDDVWATLRGGHPGFLNCPDPFHLDVVLGRDGADPADEGIEDGHAIALLGIELHTRRRNRLNGTIRCHGGTGFSVTVGQSFGNCPQYIQVRDFSFARDPAILSDRSDIRSEGLDDRARAIIRAADTFFVASYVDRDEGVRQVDVSHRGGRPGFVRIDDDGTLTIPDFAGNRFFNTLGNFTINPKAGLAFADFSTGDMLQMTGDVELVLESPEIARLQGAERIWHFRPRVVLHRPDALPLRWAFRDGGWSPQVLRTGSWAAAG